MVATVCMAMGVSNNLVLTTFACQTPRNVETVGCVAETMSSLEQEGIIPGGSTSSTAAIGVVGAAAFKKYRNKIISPTHNIYAHSSWTEF